MSISLHLETSCQSLTSSTSSRREAHLTTSFLISCVVAVPLFKNGVKLRFVEFLVRGPINCLSFSHCVSHTLKLCVTGHGKTKTSPPTSQFMEM